MAQYVFDTMSQSDASAFTTADYLFFLSGGVSTLGVVDTGSTTTITALGTTTTDETITLTENGKSLTFGATALSQASINNHVVFNNDIAIFGTEGNNTTLATTGGTAGHAAVAFGFAGNDSIVGGTANDTLNGGDGNDTITGSSGTTDSSGHFTETRRR